MSQYQPGDPVNVRSGTQQRRPGVVALADADKIIVDLDAPWPTADQWSGVTRRYGGSDPVKQVTIWVASEVVNGGHIEPRA